MMNKEEIIKLIEETKKEIDKQAVTANANVYFMTKEKAEWFIALAHKHALSKKPIEVTEKYEDLNATYTYYLCPSCKNETEQTQNYCDYCGQLLNWWGNEDEQAED